jgi:hypothetical protein
MAKLTPRQAAALERIQNGGTADQGMIAALTRKGYLGDGMLAQREVPAPQKVAASAPQARSYAGRKWNSLSDLRDRILLDGSEEIISFDGVRLVTNQNSYGMVDSQLVVS